MATKKDYIIVSIIGVLFGLFSIPILENIRPAFWQLSVSNAILLSAVFLLFANLALWIGSLAGTKIFAAWQFVKFAAIGSLNAALDVGILNFLSFIFKIYAGPPIILFNVISVSTAMINSYLLNKLWAFKSETPIRLKEIISFIIVSLASIALNTLIVYLLTTTVGHPESISKPVWENISKLIAVPLTLIFNFFGYKYFVFKK